MIEWVVAFLIALIFAQNIFWMKICYDLNNRLMSRNYYDYSQAQALQYPTSNSSQVVTKEIDFEAERQAQELNSLMGVV